MFELIYLVSICLFFGVVKLITTYGKIVTESSYPTRRTETPFMRLSAMPLPCLLLIIIVGFIPLLNTILALVGFIYAVINGCGPSAADIGDWFKTRFKKKGE